MNKQEIFHGDFLYRSGEIAGQVYGKWLYRSGEIAGQGVKKVCILHKLL